MFGRRRNRGADPNSKEQNGVIEVNPDVSRTRIQQWGGRLAVLQIGDSLIERYIVDQHAPVNYASSPKRFIEMTDACAEKTLGDNATSRIHVPSESAGYISRYERRSEKDTFPRAVSAGVGEVEQVSGPLEIHCADADGNVCPKADTCAYVGSLVEIELFTITGIATVDIDHYEN